MHAPARGLTLIECLVAVVILGIGLVAMLQCVNAALVTDQRANRYTLAAARANTIIEEIRSYGVPHYIFNATGAEGTALTLRRAVPATLDLPEGQESIIIATYTADSALTSKMWVATVTITWTSHETRTERVALATLVSNRTK
jgi:prepilin-type N-terminal cleavage/methylation domain-containing protein